MQERLPLRSIFSALVVTSCFVLAGGATRLGANERPGPGNPLVALGEEEALDMEAELEKAFESIRKRYEEADSVENRILLIPDIATVPCAKAVSFLKGLYKEESNAGIHIAVTETLGKIGSLPAVQAVISTGLPLLVSDSYNVLAVARALECELSPEAESWVLKKGLVADLRRDDDLWIAVVEALCGFKDPEKVDVLTRELARATEPKVQIAILESLEGVESKSLERAAGSLLLSRDPEVQVAALTFLHQQGGERYKSRFLANLRSKHWQVRLLCLSILARLGEKKIVDLAARALDDPEPKVQLTAVRVLMRHGGIKGIPHLISHLDGAPDRVKDDIADALARLTGKNIGPVGGQWESWWAQNEKRFKGRELTPLSAEEFSKLKESETEQRTTYHGHRLLSDKVVFVIDTSQSMEEEYVPLAEREDDDRGRTVVVDPSAKPAKKTETKIEVAKRELIKVLTGLPDGKKIDIVGFDSVVVDFIRDLLRKEPGILAVLSPAVRQAAIGFVNRAQPAGQTYMLQALEMAFLYEDADTIFLLSDGAPTPESGSQQTILEKVRRINRLRNVRINTIGFDLKPDEKEFLRELADEHFGVFLER